MTAHQCDFCDCDGGEIIWRSAKCRVVAVGGTEGDDYAGFCRVIWNTHVKEMSDLSDADKSLLMAVVFRVESTLRAALNPEKMNLASLGNMTPHVHWHVIPRFASDPNFPNAIWASRKIAAKTDVLDTLTLEDGRAKSFAPSFAPPSAPSFVPRSVWLEAVRRGLQTLQG